MTYSIRQSPANEDPYNLHLNISAPIWRTRPSHFGKVAIDKDWCPLTLYKTARWWVIALFTFDEIPQWVFGFFHYPTSRMRCWVLKTLWKKWKKGRSFNLIFISNLIKPHSSLIFISIPSQILSISIPSFTYHFSIPTCQLIHYSFVLISSIPFTYFSSSCGLFSYILFSAL